jgi:hypothetical protein
VRAPSRPVWRDRGAAGDLGKIDAANSSQNLDEPQDVVAAQARFLRQRFAVAIERGDEATAARLTIQLDRLLNGPRS